ncbi:MAG TPA: glycosyltransferase, partial [Pedobacter sp.]
ADLFYADLDYVNDKGAVVRKWRSDQYNPEKFNWGWMPPHPTFYAKRELFDRWGLYDTHYGTAADYELMLRFMYSKKARVFYLNEVIVKMISGGVSNAGYKNRIRAWAGDLKAMKKHRIRIPLLSVILKPLRKFSQFLIK